MKLILFTLAAVSAAFLFRRSTTERQLANDYFPVQSPSEEALGHPIVGVS